jgi:CheY-like chemotaxis protein
MVRVCVRDYGIGVDALQLSSLFTLFSQVDSALERSQGGLGIGLALAKGLAELHGGSIEAFSEGLGKGAEFAVTLPLSSGPPVDVPPTRDVDAAAVEAPAGEPKRVLVVDDNADVAESLALVLSSNGFRVRTANDGERAIEIVREFEPDAVVLDLGMPGMSGYEAGRRIRGGPRGKELLLIAYTGWGQLDDRRRTREAGFDDHFVKPFSPAALARTLSTRLQASAE